MENQEPTSEQKIVLTIFIILVAALVTAIVRKVETQERVIPVFSIEKANEACKEEGGVYNYILSQEKVIKCNCRNGVEKEIIKK